MTLHQYRCLGSSIIQSRRFRGAKLLLTALLPAGVLVAHALTSAGPALASGAGTDALGAGQALYGGQSLYSANGEFIFKMQSDGNLVLYRLSGNAGYAGGSPNVPIWYTGMFTTNSPGAYVNMQTDGNLVLYNSSHQPLWQSGTSGHLGANSYLTVQSDGNLVIRTGTGSLLWTPLSNQRNTTLYSGDYLKPGWLLESSDGRYELIMQTDGNLVTYATGTTSWVWTSATHNYSGAGQNYAWMQSNGDLVVWNAYYQEAEWHSGTNNNPDAYAVIQTDGNLGVHAQGGGLLWSSTLRAWAPWTPNSSATGFFDEWDYSDDPTGTLGEYGIDVPLTASTPINAPEPGTIIAYQRSSCPSDPDGICWNPGRLLERLDNGAVVGFGHVNSPLIPVGSRVLGGREIATVGDNSWNWMGSHVEFMYDATGSGGTGYGYRPYFLPPPMVSPANGCPRHQWTATGGNGPNPCTVLSNYMHGIGYHG